MLRFLIITLCCSFAFVFLASSAPAQERVTRELDGAKVTLPAEEADLADSLLKFSKVWQDAMQKGVLSKAFRGYLMDPKAAQNTQRRVADHLGISGDEDNLIRQDWEESVKLAERAINAWVSWEKGFDTIHFWTKAEAEKFRQHDRLVFQDTEVQVRDDGAGFRMRPGFLPEPIDLDTLPAPEAVAPHRLDFVLAYPIGATPGEITKQYNELLNRTITDQSKGVVAVPAGEIYDEMYRRIFERALERHLVSDAEGRFFRRGLSLAYSAARNDQVEPERGRKQLFGKRLMQIANRESEQSIADLGKRINETSPWPTESDGHPEKATREVALAMVFLSLKNGGNSLDGWIQKQETTLDARAFSDRLAEASSDEGWESVFRDYCGALADQFIAALSDKTTTELDATLSVIEEAWPRVVSGRVEVIHPLELTETAQLTAERVDALLAGYVESPGDAYVPKLSADQRQWLSDHGFPIPDEAAESWTEIYQRAALGGISRLRVRLWFIDEAQAALNAGQTIPGFTVDPETQQVTISDTLGVQRVYQIGSDTKSANFDNPVSSLIVPIPRDEAAILSPERQALAVENHCRKQLDRLFTMARTGENDEERFFLVASYVAGEFLLREVIASRNREWFVIGLSNWIGMQLTDLEFGPGAGRRVFESRWPPEKNEPMRDQIDLMKWESSTDGESGPLDAENAYFATLAIQSALEGKDADFTKHFIEEIQKTPWKRTHLGTVIRAYRTVGGGDLKRHAQTVITENN